MTIIVTQPLGAKLCLQGSCLREASKPACSRSLAATIVRMTQVSGSGPFLFIHTAPELLMFVLSGDFCQDSIFLDNLCIFGLAIFFSVLLGTATFDSVLGGMGDNALISLNNFDF
jgi:hypothetical protein